MLAFNNGFLKSTFFPLVICLPLLTSCAVLDSSYTNSRESIDLYQMQNAFKLEVMSMGNTKGLLTDGPKTQTVGIKSLKKKINIDKAVSEDNLEWGSIIIEMPSYYGPSSFLAIRSQTDFVDVQQGLKRFTSWAKLPYGQREQAKDSVNANFRRQGMGTSERKRFGDENFWSVVNDKQTQQPFLVLNKNYKRSTLPSNTIGFSLENANTLSDKFESLYTNFNILNQQKS